MSPEDALARVVLAKANALDMVSELDYEEFIDTITSRALVLPVALGRAGNSDKKSLQRIEYILDSKLDEVVPGLKFSGTVQDGTTNPFLARRGELVLCDATTSSFIVRLPDPSVDHNAKAQVNVKLVAQAGANAVTVDVEGGGTIDGDLTLVLNIVDISYKFYVADGEYKVV